MQHRLLRCIYGAHIRFSLNAGRLVTDSRAGGLFQRLLVLAHSALVERKFEFNYVLHKQIQNSKAVVITLHLLYTAPLHAIMQARATSAQKLTCSSRCTLTEAPFVRKGALDGSVHAAYTRSILTSTSYGKLRKSALLYQTHQYAPHPRTLSAHSHVRAQSRQTEDRQPVINVPRFRLLRMLCQLTSISICLVRGTITRRAC